MRSLSPAKKLIELEAEALLARLMSIMPFSLHMTMVPAASISTVALKAIELLLGNSTQELGEHLNHFLTWLRSGGGRAVSPEDAQRRFTIIRMRFNNVLSSLDIFADVLTQRSEHETGVWVAGLDVLAADALKAPGIKNPPSMICYLDRGHGAAIRRARTRLPGGDNNPVAVIRIPRERMIGTGIASSLVHEVGHQAAAMLGLVDSLRAEILQRADDEPRHRLVWNYWARTISEIIADCWSVGRIGIGATLGLMSVLNLPRHFVFRVNANDVHPFPWIRARISCALGESLYPHQQWTDLKSHWSSLYDPNRLRGQKRNFVKLLINSEKQLAELIVNHRLRALGNHQIGGILRTKGRDPRWLKTKFDELTAGKVSASKLAPSEAFAVLGQARYDHRLHSKREYQMLSGLLKEWALRSN